MNQKVFVYLYLIGMMGTYAVRLSGVLTAARGTKKEDVAQRQRKSPQRRRFDLGDHDAEVFFFAGSSNPVRGNPLAGFCRHHASGSVGIRGIRSVDLQQLAALEIPQRPWPKLVFDRADQIGAVPGYPRHLSVPKASNLHRSHFMGHRTGHDAAQLAGGLAHTSINLGGVCLAHPQ